MSSRRRELRVEVSIIDDSGGCLVTAQADTDLLRGLCDGLDDLARGSCTVGVSPWDGHMATLVLPHIEIADPHVLAVKVHQVVSGVLVSHRLGDATVRVEVHQLLTFSHRPCDGLLDALAAAAEMERLVAFRVGDRVQVGNARALVVASRAEPGPYASVFEDAVVDYHVLQDDGNYHPVREEWLESVDETVEEEHR